MSLKLVAIRPQMFEFSFWPWHVKVFMFIWVINLPKLNGQISAFHGGEDSKNFKWRPGWNQISSTAVTTLFCLQ